VVLTERCCHGQTLSDGASWKAGPRKLIRWEDNIKMEVEEDCKNEKCTELAEGRV
jgi:hypothetical protein